MQSTDFTVRIVPADGHTSGSAIMVYYMPHLDDSTRTCTAKPLK